MAKYFMCVACQLLSEAKDTEILLPSFLKLCVCVLCVCDIVTLDASFACHLLNEFKDTELPSFINYAI